ncbi:MAG: DUF4386 domain-containing protein [Bacteroidetes bacterium]|nr:DUF4386 domain-containing protein [Bacteroidota bacterium]MBK9415518.1 DUF4386 domain-containing protein [Bacteroidota bacterium]MBL0033588.1 DUF4386 domain-containing protein [Bacteroidota bacterium]MBP6427406.1 DUF4386 domain-containing protein [Bacteroidia bacterium]MBP6658165.1 DUF4386 domain-containing protein [Bacteroidia bacterium]
MNTHRTIGLLLIIAGVTLLIPYTMLTIIFEYPDILRQDTSVILHKFHDGGSELIWTWFAFAMTGIPLLPAFILLGQKLENKTASARLATTLGVIGLIVQIVGLLRWTFVVPVLAETFVNATDDSTKAATILAFKTIHQFAGVLLGEHLGQLFSIAWTVLISFTLLKQKMIPRWLGAFGFIASFIYLLAQAELFATVIPSFPVWDLAGFVGSTLWLIWLIIVGVTFLRKDAPTPRSA